MNATVSNLWRGDGGRDMESVHVALEYVLGTLLTRVVSLPEVVLFAQQ